MFFINANIYIFLFIKLNLFVKIFKNFIIIKIVILGFINIIFFMYLYVFEIKF